MISVRYVLSVMEHRMDGIIQCVLFLCLASGENGKLLSAECMVGAVLATFVLFH